MPAGLDAVQLEWVHTRDAQWIGPIRRRESPGDETVMRKIKASCVLALLLCLCSGCATYNQVSPGFAPLSSGQGRIYFYREFSLLKLSGIIWSPDIRLNNIERGTEVVGSSRSGWFFYVDRPAGDYSVSIPFYGSEYSFSLAANETKYFCTDFGGQGGQYFGDKDSAIKVLGGCLYAGGK
jgi:hypothetical protein